MSTVREKRRSTRFSSFSLSFFLLPTSERKSPDTRAHVVSIIIINAATYIQFKVTLYIYPRIQIFQKQNKNLKKKTKLEFSMKMNENWSAPAKRANNDNRKKGRRNENVFFFHSCYYILYCITTTICIFLEQRTPIATSNYFLVIHYYIAIYMYIFIPNI